MMMPNMVKYPVIMIPIFLTAAISGIASGIIGISGTKESAGFGFIGMVGPINAFKFMHVDSAWLSLLLIVIAFFVVPFLVSLTSFHPLYMLKLDVILLYFNIEKSLQRSKRRRDTKLYPINLKISFSYK